MIILLRWLGRLLVWIGPALVLLLAVASGFLFWTVRSESGTRWAVQTAVSQLGGQVQGIEGTLWNGVRIQDLNLDQPDFSVQVKGAHLQVDWSDLGARRLHVVDVSAQSVAVELHATTAAEPDTGPLAIPVLPVTVAVDRIALGQFTLRQDGKPVPVSVHDFASSLSLADGHAQWVLNHVVLQTALARVGAEGEATLDDLHAPWPLTAHLALKVQGQGKDSPLCVRRYVAALPQSVDKERHGGKGDGSREGQSDGASHDGGSHGECSAEVNIVAKGDIDQMDVSLSGQGQSLTLTGQALLAPTAAFPLRRAALGLMLADGSFLQGRFDWAAAGQGASAAGQDAATSGQETKVVGRRPEVAKQGMAEEGLIRGSLKAYKLDLGALAGPVVPESILTATADFDARLLGHRDLRAADLQVHFDKGSSWNHQPLSGTLAAKVVDKHDRGTIEDTRGTAEDAQDALLSLVLDSLDVDLTLGANRVKAKGSLGATKSRLALDAQMPSLAAFWPTLSGGATVRGQLGGTPSHHEVDLKASFTPGVKDVKGGSRAGPDTAARTVRAAVALTGEWGPLADTRRTEQPAVRQTKQQVAQQAGQKAKQQAGQQWRGTVSELKLDYDGLGGRLVSPVKITLTQPAPGQAWQWLVGAADIRALLPLKESFVIHNTEMRGSAAQWQVRGGIPRLAVSRALIDALRKTLAPLQRGREDAGSVHVDAPPRKTTRRVVLAADWNLAFDGALKGNAHVRRLSGDLWVPGEPGFPLGLRDLGVALTATPRGKTASLLEASVDVSTAKMGNLHAKGTAVMHTSGQNAWTLDAGVPQSLRVKADIADLSWVNMWLGDETELGGALDVDVQARSAANGTWTTGGTIRGSGIKIIRVDDGVRLIGGTLDAHLDGNRLVLDSLRFPAELRVKPKEWRTATWVSENPDAKNGSLTLTGSWDLFASTGVINVELYRYPILQRTDRYAMVSGKITVNAQLPAISIVGGIKADAGWFNLDVLGSVPALDSDVVVVRPGQKQQVKVPPQISLDLKIDLGPRFYLTGYGVDSGLVGNMHILMNGNKITGIGQLRTRGGAIDVYGQHLRLRRGTVTFQGNISNPVLDIEALRTGLPVEAGVRVGGTARKPKIDLVSYPDVSEVEKLSWLLLGRAPDGEGNDVGLLFSVGTSILGDGEPFYRKMGLDELGIRTGELGSTGSVLPPQSVVSGINNNASELEQQFAIASKHFGNGVTLSLEQALAATGTVGRASYKLSRRLRAELSVGTVNGIALVYRVFFNN